MRVTRHTRLFVSAAACALALGCSNGSDPKPVPANSPVTITTATPYAQPPQPTIVNSTGLTAGASATPAAREVTYKMEAGDTLLALAARFGSSVEAIMKRNNLSSPTELKIGQEIVIPTNSTILATTTPTGTAVPVVTASSTPRPTATATSIPTAAATAASSGILTVYTVQKGDNSFDIAGKFGVTVEDLAAANGKTVAQLASIQIGDQLNIPRPR
jgi:LysM repeat protein